MIFCILILATTKALARLGEASSTIDRDHSTLGGKSLKQSQIRTNYSVYEMDNDGTVIREYVSDGVVFAVTWQGLRHPDLSVLLGSYYSDYKIAKYSAPKVSGHQPSEIKVDSLVVRHAGHMRDLRGKAFLSELVPNGVDVEGLE